MDEDLVMKVFKGLKHLSENASRKDTGAMSYNTFLVQIQVNHMRGSCTGIDISRIKCKLSAILCQRGLCREP